VNSPTGSKTVISPKIINQFKILKYFGHSLSYEGGKDPEVEISNLLIITELTNTIFEPSEVQKHIRIVSLTLLCGHESWTMIEKPKPEFMR
jgi:hypothetical protein